MPAVQPHNPPQASPASVAMPHGRFDNAPRDVDVLRMLADAAFACAGSHAPGFRFVLARADRLELRPAIRAPREHAPHAEARIVFQGRSSLTIATDIHAEPHGRPAASGLFMLVAVDDAGVPVPLPTVDQPSPKDSPP